MGDPSFNFTEGRFGIFLKMEELIGFKLGGTYVSGKETKWALRVVPFIVTKVKSGLVSVIMQ